MPTPPPHPAIASLLDAMRERLQMPKLPASALSGALSEALGASPAPDGRITPWMHDLVWSATRVSCRRLGLRLPEPPSITVERAAPVRDHIGESLLALYPMLDPETANVLSALEGRDAREAQVAVQLGLPPRRVGVLARQGRDALHALLPRLLQGVA